MKRRVVVTGLGLVSPVGNTTESTWQALTAGKSGAAPIDAFDTARFSVKFACDVKGFDPLEYMERKEAKRADRLETRGCWQVRQARRTSCLR